MSRPVTLFTGQWADLDFETICHQHPEPERKLNRRPFRAA